MKLNQKNKLNNSKKLKEHKVEEKLKKTFSKFNY